MKAWEDQLKELFGLDATERLHGHYSCTYTKPRWGASFYHGQLYVFTSCMVFHANLIAVLKTVRVCFQDVKVIRKRNFMRMPNTIAVERSDGRQFVFTSFVFARRQAAFDTLVGQWRGSNPTLAAAYLDHTGYYSACSYSTCEGSEAEEGEGEGDEGQEEAVAEGGAACVRGSCRQQRQGQQQALLQPFPKPWSELLLPAVAGSTAAAAAAVGVPEGVKLEESASCVVQGNARQVAEVLLSDVSGFLPHAMSQQAGNTLVSMTPWQVSSSSRVLQRTFKYTHTSSGRFSARSIVVQQQQLRVWGDGRLTLKISQSMPELPAGVGQAMEVIILWELTPNDSSSCGNSSENSQHTTITAAAAAAGAVAGVGRTSSSLTEIGALPLSPARLVDTAGATTAAAPTSNTEQPAAAAAAVAAAAAAAASAGVLASSVPSTPKGSSAQHKTPKQQQQQQQTVEADAAIASCDQAAAAAAERSESVRRPVAGHTGQVTQTVGGGFMGLGPDPPQPAAAAVAQSSGSSSSSNSRSRSSKGESSLPAAAQQLLLVPHAKSCPQLHHHQQQKQDWVAHSQAAGSDQQQQQQQQQQRHRRQAAPTTAVSLPGFGASSRSIKAFFAGLRRTMTGSFRERQAQHWKRGSNKTAAAVETPQDWQQQEDFAPAAPESVAGSTDAGSSSVEGDSVIEHASADDEAASEAGSSFDHQQQLQQEEEEEQEEDVAARKLGHSSSSTSSRRQGGDKAGAVQLSPQQATDLEAAAADDDAGTAAAGLADIDTGASTAQQLRVASRHSIGSSSSSSSSSNGRSRQPSAVSSLLAGMSRTTSPTEAATATATAAAAGASEQTGDSNQQQQQQNLKAGAGQEGSTTTIAPPSPAAAAAAPSMASAFDAVVAAAAAAAPAADGSSSSSTTTTMHWRVSVGVHWKQPLSWAVRCIVQPETLSSTSTSQKALLDTAVRWMGQPSERRSVGEVLPQAGRVGQAAAGGRRHTHRRSGSAGSAGRLTHGGRSMVLPPAGASGRGVGLQPRHSTAQHGSMAAQVTPSRLQGCVECVLTLSGLLVEGAVAAGGVCRGVGQQLGLLGCVVVALGLGHLLLMWRLLQLLSVLVVKLDAAAV